jgi:hypothetical protein
MGYRRRLAAAAAASLALHLLLARGLALTHVSVDGGATEPAARKTLAPRRRADFALRAAESSRQPRPAHERPLDVSPRPDTAPRPTAEPRRDEPAAAERREREATTWTAAPVPLPAIRPPRGDTALAAAAAADRAAAAAPEAGDVPLAPVSAAAATPAAPAALPAAISRPPTPTATASVARRQPREVALLERLTAPRRTPLDASGIDAAADRAARGPAEPASRATASPTRRGAAPAAVADDAAAVAATPPTAATTTDGRTAAAPRQVARASSAAAASRRASDRAAPESAPAATVGAGVAAAATSAAFSGSAAGRDPGLATSATPGRAAVVGSAADAATVAAAPAGGAATGIATTATASVAATPRAVGRAAGPATTPAAATAGRRSGADTGDDEGLSTAAPASAALAAAIGPGVSEDSAGAAALAGPAPLQRIATTPLPAEGRVRDVAEAFARRGAARRDDREGSAGGRATAAALQADAVVDRGLEFLVRSQQPDGRWCLGRYAGAAADVPPKLTSDTAATGLALLCFLGAGHDHFDGPHRDTVRRGIEFLVAAQRPDGDLYLKADPLSDSCAWLYSHGIAAMALCEAVGMTGDARVRPAAAKACAFIAASQHPSRGGWRYTPRTDADLSVSGWMVVALRAGDLARVPVERRSLAAARRLLEASSFANDPARYAYNAAKPDQRPSPLSASCMTAVGSLLRLHTGETAQDPRVVAAAAALAARRPSYGSTTEKTRDSYLWYYASQVLVHTGGPAWDAWYAELVNTLAPRQETAGPRAGSWDPLGDRPDRWGLYGGRLYVTALHLLALEVPDRHLPTYSAKPAE